jgi:DNA (cytosine-5)-methyltransferase 1
MKAIELFVGAGGLGMGTARAGFEHVAVVEWNHDACATIRANQERGVSPVEKWPLFETDARTFDFRQFAGKLDLVAGGPPCQPFSIAGKHRGNQDDRDMFPQAVRAVREIRPKAFLFENVRGLTRQSFAHYFEYILLQLQYPEVARGDGEGWLEHLSRLERHHTGGLFDGLRYNIVFRVLNAADYGVPQKRERVFIVGFRSDLSTQWAFPNPSHTREALQWSKWVSGEYWEQHRVARKNRPQPKPEELAGLSGRLFPAGGRWHTVRDAIADLPDPQRPHKAEILNHDYQSGARVYPGHTGSPLDEPAKTLKAGAHGVPGGENMMVLPDGSVRYFTVRETARLQTFPDNYVFRGSWGENMRQLGNAVPVSLAGVVADSVRAQLDGEVRG